MGSDLGGGSEGDASTGGETDSIGGGTDATAAATTTTGEGTTGGAETGGEEVPFEIGPVYGVPNIDDDDEDGASDWYQLVFDGDDDVSSLAIPGVPEGYRVEMTLVGDLDDIRIWHGEEFAIGVATNITQDTYAFAPGAEGATLHVVFGEYNATGQLQVSLLDPDGTQVQSVEVPLRASPLIMNHHLQPTEHVWVVDVDAGFGSNAAMVAEFQNTLGDRFTAVPGAQYGYDVWIQDEVEFATSIGHEGQRLNTVIDSIRDRGLDPFAENMVVRPSFITRTWGNPAEVTTWDSFGNLEASPPVTIDGVEYPFGRIYYGKQGALGIHDEMSGVLQAQSVQAPFELDTLWLCVSHVDEFSTFVPDPSSDKGFKLLLSDVPSAYALLEDLDPNLSLTRYGQDHPPYDTVGDLLADPALRALNEDLQEFELNPIRETFKAELGLEDADIVEIPALFEEIGGCGGGVAALIPGTVNLIVANPEGEATHLFIPDPFFRTNLADQSSDPVLQDFASRVPEGMQLHFVDNWDVYHLGLGEVHCGTNVQRTPLEEWFTSAMHLLENE